MISKFMVGKLIVGKLIVGKFMVDKFTVGKFTVSSLMGSEFMGLNRRVQWIASLAVILASWIFGAGLALAEPQAWDQQKATKLAREFSDTIEKIITDAKTAPLQKTAIRQRTRDGALNSMGDVRTAADTFAKQLESGRDGSATELFFAQVRQMFQQTVLVARDAVAVDQQRANLDAAESLLDQLGRYYDY